MGDILAQWDEVKKKEKAAAREKAREAQVSHKKANALTAEEKELQKAKNENPGKPVINPMESRPLWIPMHRKNTTSSFLM